ncbi:hypothetical protein CJF32_00004059 [Rutstroemia sp. NJR-2017a WRK4]|nr:hypothetical protein CJF32_00004059 [Rutstroemia sp. NJR-2017a WRK4]
MPASTSASKSSNKHYLPTPSLSTKSHSTKSHSTSSSTSQKATHGSRSSRSSSSSHASSSSSRKGSHHTEAIRRYENEPRDYKSWVVGEYDGYQEQARDARWSELERDVELVEWAT